MILFVERTIAVLSEDLPGGFNFCNIATLPNSRDKPSLRSDYTKHKRKIVTLHLEKTFYIDQIIAGVHTWRLFSRGYAALPKGLYSV